MSPLLAALLLLGSVTLKPETPRLRAGGQVSVPIDVEVRDDQGKPIHGAAVRVSVQLGQLGPVLEMKPGLYRALYSPPPERFPQVALIVADVEGPSPQRAWAPLSLFGVQALKLSTKPHARVEVRVEGKAFGPWNADGRGAVTASIEVPPGATTAQVRSTDRLGNVKERSVALDPPPFPRVRLLPDVGVVSASWAAAPASLVAYVVDVHGKPSSEPLVWTAQTGALSTPTLRRPGEWVAAFTAPASLGPTGTATLKVQPASGGPVASLALPLTAGPASSLRMEADHDALSGDGTPLELSVSARDVHDNALTPPALRVSTTLGRLEPLETPGHYRLHAPTFWQGKTALTVVAVSGSVRAERTFALHAGNAVRGRLWLHPWLVYAGEGPIQAELRLQDAAGNAAGDERVTVVVGERDPLTVSRAEATRFQFPLAVNDVSRMTTETVRVGPAGTPLAQAQLTTLPRRNAWGLSVGAWAQVQTNFAGARAFTPTLELAARPARFPLEIVAQVSDGLFSAVRHAYPDAGAGVVQATRVNSVTALVGARYSYPLAPIVSLHFSLLAGAAWTRAQTRLENSATPDLVVNARATSFAGRIAGGVSVRAGPGRVVAELQGTYVPVSTSALHGNLGGLGLAAGYLYEIR